MPEITIGLLLIILGAIVLIAEAFVPGFFIGVAGTAMIVLGIFAMIIGDAFFFTPWAPVVAILTTICAMAFSIWFYKKLGGIQVPMATVGDSLIGREGIVVRATVPESTTKGKVRIGSQVWSATSAKRIPEGTKVKVVGSEGVHVIVERVRGPKSNRK
jgi:membrane-bound ClpP family serine protease